MPDRKIRAAIALARAGRRRQARELFLQVVEEHPHHEVAWLWLVGLVDEVEDQIVALENVLVINPENHRARARLERLRRMKEATAAPSTPAERVEIGREVEQRLSSRELLARARQYESNGQFEQAVAAYEQVKAIGETRQQRQRAGKRLRDVQRRMELGQPVPVHTTFTLLRLSLGPFLLYLLLTFVHAAFRPLRVSPLLCMGSLAVLGGSLLLVGTRITSRHPWWRQLFDGQQLHSRLRTGLGWLGFFLVFLPYILFLVAAYGRLKP